MLRFEWGMLYEFESGMLYEFESDMLYEFESGMLYMFESGMLYEFESGMLKLDTILNRKQYIQNKKWNKLLTEIHLKQFKAKTTTTTTTHLVGGMHFNSTYTMMKYRQIVKPLK